MTVVEIPDPGLVVLIGPAGAGKTTFAARHFAPSEVLSSDAYRALIAGDEADQGATRAAFGRLHLELQRRLRAGQLSVVDATNVERSARAALLQRARAAGLPSVAIVFDLPAAIVLARNAARLARVVDEAVIRRHLDRLRRDVERAGHGDIATALRAEGFVAVTVLRDPPAADAVTIVRVGGRS